MYLTGGARVTQDIHGMVPWVTQDRRTQNHRESSDVQPQAFRHLATYMWNLLGWSDAVSVIYPTPQIISDLNCWKTNQTSQYFPCWEPGSLQPSLCLRSLSLFLLLLISNKLWKSSSGRRRSFCKEAPPPWHLGKFPAVPGFTRHRNPDLLLTGPGAGSTSFHAKQLLP